MMTRTWTDQPHELENAEIVADIPTRDTYHIEVRTDGRDWFITYGNLFGSQTVKCDSAETVLRTVGLATRARKLPMSPPTGTVLMVNGGKDET